MASATELVVAFVMGAGGSLYYAMDGFVDIRLSMIILAGSLFGIQIGAIGTTYVKDYLVKLVMATIYRLIKEDPSADIGELLSATADEYNAGN